MKKNIVMTEEKKKISSFEAAPIAKRLFAAMMDAVVFLFTFFLLAVWVMTPIANAGMGYQDKNTIGETYQFASHLYLAQKLDDNGNVINVNVKDSTGKLSDYKSLVLYYSDNTSINFYINRIYYYYHNFKTNTDIELPTFKEFDPIKDYFASPIYDEAIDGILPKDLYTNEWFSKTILKIESEDTYFKIDASATNYLESISLVDETKNEDAIRYLKNCAIDACEDLFNSSYFAELNKQIKYIQFFIFGSAFAVSFSIFYILIPLLMKDGETLGKKTMHISVISFDGFKAKKRQILFREVLLFVYVGILGFAIGIGLASFAYIALGVLVAFILTLLSKFKRSMFDFASFTIVVDAIHSTWFKDEEDEERHRKELEDNMAKYKKYVPDEDKLIQVGTKILDEDLKKEVEEQKKKNK